MIPLLLLLLLGLVLGAGVTLAACLAARRRWQRATGSGRPQLDYPSFKLDFAPRPASWLAIRSQSPRAVREVLDQFAPRPWSDGPLSGYAFFIAPPAHGWIIVTGPGLPDPGEDVDECFHFFTALSRKLGSVQFFQAERVLRHHAWVRLENGKVERAYAWASGTVWNQGARTEAELDLSVKCFGYDERPAPDSWAAPEWIAANVAKVPLLAARWSIDPARINGYLRRHADGVPGDLI